MIWKGFSQTVIDSTQIQLTKPIARLVIKDLIQYDGLNKEVQSLKLILTETTNKFNSQSKLVNNLQTQIITYQSIIDEKQKQTNSQQELNKLLQLDLKKQKLRTKLTSGAGILLVVGAVVLIK
tara:strand:+ start:2123 stop:2491 length:369 start_codon:yes stop_codon:yes gene_type:complete